MHLSVVVPTYREAENLRALVPAVARAVEGTGRPGEILVVDDDSPDDTPAVCAELSRRHPLKLLVRKNERGLATAVLHGLRQAAGDTLVVMDADLSHPPEKIPDLAAALDDGAEFAIGSRYVPGAHTDENWGWFRRLNSRVATALARGVTGIHDPMAGFFALRRDTFRAARDLDPIGYKIALELIVKCGCRQVAEVPITFRNRTRGESKLNLKEQINYLRHLRRLYAYKWWHERRSA